MPLHRTLGIQAGVLLCYHYLFMLHSVMLHSKGHFPWPLGEMMTPSGLLGDLQSVSPNHWVVSGGKDCAPLLLVFQDLNMMPGTWQASKEC